MTAPAKHKRRIAATAMAACVLAAWWWWPRPGPADKPGGRWTAAQVRVLGDALIERGLLAPMEEQAVVATATGDIVQMTRTGTRVNAGDVLLLLDAGEREEALEELTMNLATLELDREVQRAAGILTAAREDGERQIREHRLTLARLQLRQAETPLAPEDRRLIEIDQAVAALDLLDAREELARQDRLLTQGFISAAMIEPFERRVLAAEARVEELHSRLLLRERGSGEEKVVEYRAQVARLEGILARATQARERRLEAHSNNVAVTEANIARTALSATNALEELGATRVLATTGGVFQVRLFQDWRAGGTWTEYRAGVPVGRDDVVADIVQPGRMRIQLMLHEADVNRVQTGLPAHVRVGAFPDRAFEGRLATIGGLGRDRFELAPPGEEDSATGVTVFNAIVELHADDAEFRPGMSATVRIPIEPPREALVIPRAALRHGREGWSVLRRRAHGPAQAAPVSGRMADPFWFEVETGLEAGDEVFVPAAAGGTPL